MNAEISLFVVCVEAIIYLLLYNLQDCTFKNVFHRTPSGNCFKYMKRKSNYFIAINLYKKQLNILRQ